MAFKHQEKNIKKITAFTSHFGIFQTGPKDDTREFLSSMEVYNENGDIIEDVKYFEDGDEDERALYEYDDQNRVTSEQIAYALSESSDRREIRRDDNARTEEEIIFYGEEPGEKIITKFNEDKDPVEIITYNDEGGIETRQLMTYARPNKVKKEEMYDADGELIKKVVNHYDDNGELIGQEMETTDEEQIPYQVVKIDKSDQEEVVSTYDNEGNLIMKNTQKLNDQEKVEEQITETFTGGHQVRVQKMEYNDQGRLALRLVLDGRGNLLRKHEWVYNEEGFIVEEYEFMNGYDGKNVNSKTRYEYEFYS